MKEKVPFFLALLLSATILISCGNKQVPDTAEANLTLQETGANSNENNNDELVSLLIGKWNCEEYTNSEGTYDSLTGDDRIAFNLKKGGKGTAFIDGFEYDIDNWIVSQNGKKLRITINGEDDTFQIIRLLDNQMVLDEELEDEVIHFIFSKQ